MTLADDVREGLTKRPKRIPSVHFYDSTGSALFDEITRQPEYYLTETERAILRRHADEIIAAAARGERLTLVELGAGSGDKTRVLIEALLERQDRVTYAPIDVSGDALLEAARDLDAAYPGLTVRPIVARNRAGLRSPDADEPGARLVLFIGSSIGNFTLADATRFLADVGAELRPQDALLLGTDMAKDEKILIPAYFDAAGVTTRFNLNLLHRINRELGADFDPDAFEHRPRFNREESRMESHLVSKRRQTVRVPKLDLVVEFEPGESLHTENSYKYSDDMIRRMVNGAGLRVECSWFDERRWFGLHLLRRPTT